MNIVEGLVEGDIGEFSLPSSEEHELVCGSSFCKQECTTFLGSTGDCECFTSGGNLERSWNGLLTTLKPRNKTIKQTEETPRCVLRDIN